MKRNYSVWQAKAGVGRLLRSTTHTTFILATIASVIFLIQIVILF